MAVSTHAPGAGERRLVYGLNVAVSIVLAIAVLVFAVLLSGQFSTQFDLTRTGRNSLSARTVKLLGGLERDVTITAIYPVRTETAEVDQRRQDAVRDLLELYEGAGGGHTKTELIDPLKKPGRMADIERRLAELPAYQNESAGHQAVIERFTQLNQQVREIIGADAQHLAELGEGQPLLARSREFQIVSMNLRQTLEEADATAQVVSEFTGEAVPRYGRATASIKSFLTLLRTYVDDARRWFNGEIGQMPTVGQAVLAEFRQMAARYEPLLAEESALDQEIDGLPRLKLEEMYETLKRRDDLPPILVETDEEAHVVRFDEVWRYRTDRNAPAGTGPDPDRDFDGESAISSSILRLTQAERTGVVFVRYGGSPLLTPDFSNFNPMMRQLPSAPFQAMRQVLERANFVTGEWDVKASKTPPALEDAARTIYVVFAPEPPQQTNPMQPASEPGISQNDKQLVIDAVGESGMAVFLTRWQTPSPMSPIPGSYEWADYLRTQWGVDPRFTHVAMPFAPSPEKQGLWVPAARDPRSVLLLSGDVLRLSEQPIVAPLKSEPIGLWMATPLEPVAGDARPEGVEITPLVEVRETDRVWAFEDIRGLENDFREHGGTKPRDGDLRAPFMLAAAATRAAGGKLVIFGSEQFAADELAQATGVAFAGGGLVAYRLYPGNTDLFVNALHWLTGDADRIAVGPRTSDVPRLSKLTEGAAVQFCQVFLVGIWPGVALLAGGVAWLLRRR